MDKICVFAPATVANLSCGFDTLGLALDHPGDTVELTRRKDSELRITEIVGAKNLPMDPAKNCCSVVVEEMRKSISSEVGFDIRIKKGFASGSGLGSSSASSAAAAMAFNELMGKPYSLKELVRFAAEGERAASGDNHGDNVTPSLIGGITLIRSLDAADILKLPVPDELYVTILHPQVKLDTSDARRVLPKQTPLKLAAKQWANLGACVSALYTNDLALLSRSLEDLIVEPARSLLIPKFPELKKAALQAGALGFGISGSGPSVFALSKGKDVADAVEKAMRKQFEGESLSINTLVQPVATVGARQVDQF